MLLRKFSVPLALYIVLSAGAIHIGNATTSTYYMDQYCDGQISVYESILLDLTKHSEYISNLKCVVTLASRGAYMNRLMARVIWTDMEGSKYNCRSERLIIYDGSSTSIYSMQLTAPGGLCGNSQLIHTYRSSTPWLTFNFTSDSSAQGRGFQILINGFDDSRICINGEFECDNGYCVDDGLECDGQNNCGDDSDEDGCDLSVGSIIAIVMGCVCGGVILAGIVIVLSSRGSKRTCCRRRVVNENAHLVTSAPPYTVYGQVPPMAPPAYSSVYPNVANPPAYPNPYEAPPPGYDEAILPRAQAASQAVLKIENPQTAAGNPEKGNTA